jgi:hypothetical protein
MVNTTGADATGLMTGNKATTVPRISCQKWGVFMDPE